MSSLIEQTIKQAADSGKNTVRHDISVKIDANPIIQAAMQAWGSALNFSRAAPSWHRIEPFIETIQESEAQLGFAMDHDGAGAIDFHWAPAQITAFSDLRDEIASVAVSVGAPQASIDQAKIAFDQAISNFLFTESFKSGEAPLSISSYLEKSQPLAPAMSHSEFGDIEAKDLHAIAKAIPPKPAAPGEDDESTPASAQPVPRSAKYASMQQMAKENDHTALTEYVQFMKSKDLWDEDKVEACNKLVLITAALGHVEFMKALFDVAGADQSFRDANGVSPFLAAAQHNHPDMLDLLKSRGADMSESTIDGLTPLMLAAQHDAADSIKKLHALGAPLDEQNLEGRTALHLAALGVDDATSNNALKALMEAGANPTIMDMIGDDGGCVAEEYIDENSDDSYSALVQYRSDWEAGRTPRAQSTISKARSLLGF